MLMRRALRSRVPTPVLGRLCHGLWWYLEGEYNRDKKVNCLMSISGDREYNIEWHDVWPQEEKGTDVYCVYVFFQRVTLSALANINAPPYPSPVPCQFFWGEKRHPSRGGKPYSDNFRHDIIMRYQLGFSLVTNEINTLCAVYAYPSLS